MIIVSMDVSLWLITQIELMKMQIMAQEINIPGKR